jgi:multidrug efflux pump subunit AcrA (membrane-fusion protein)
MNAFLKTAVLVALLGAAALFWWLFGGRPEITVAPVRLDVAVDAVPAAVKVNPEFQLTITSDVTGMVRKSYLKIGQIVRQGDVLLEIDPGAYVIELKRLEDQLANTQAQFALDFDQRNALERRKEDLAIFERRAREGDYPELELKRRREEFRIFSEQQEKDRLGREQTITNLTNSIQLQKDFITFCVLRAPASGTITEIFAQPGEVVAVRAALVRLYSEALLVEARINEEDFSGIRPGLDASVRFLAYGPELYAAKVVKVLPNADPQNQQYRAYLEVSIPADRLIPGLSGEASIIRNRRPDALIAPRAALHDGAVFLLEGDRVLRRQVEVGYRSLGAFEILDPDFPTDARLAVTRLDSLHDGRRVRVSSRD